MDLTQLTWRCHLCGSERPDAKISVFSRTHPIEDCGGATFQENIRYCNDRPGCIAGARTFTLLSNTLEDVPEHRPHSEGAMIYTSVDELPENIEMGAIFHDWSRGQRKVFDGDRWVSLEEDYYDPNEPDWMNHPAIMWGIVVVLVLAVLMLGWNVTIR